MTAALLGFLLGLRHALDPDHVAAVSTIVTRERSVARAASVGAWWGLGHSATILVAGGAIVATSATVPDSLALGAEFVVALMLIALGVANIARPQDATPPRRSTAVLIGMVHGLAGTAALALLVLTAVPGTDAGLAYLAVFGAGTVAGMVAVTVAISVPMLSVTAWPQRATGYLRIAAGLAAIAVGLGLAHGVGTEWVAR